MGEKIPEKGNSLSKGSKVRACLAFLRIYVEVVMVGVEWMRGEAV